MFDSVKEKFLLVGVLLVYIMYLMNWHHQWCIRRLASSKMRFATLWLRLCCSVTMKTPTRATSGTPPGLQDLAEARFWNASIPRRVKNPVQTALLLNSRSQKLQTGPNNPRQEGHKAGFVEARMQSGLLADMRPERIF